MPHARALLALVFAFALARPAPAVVGPARDGDGYADRVVMVLARHGGRQSVCSGVAIRPRVVLTAAHCLAGAAETLVAIRVEGRTQPAPVSAVAAHPQYNPAGPRERRVSVDLGLVRLAAPLSGFRFAEIARKAPEIGDAITLVGYGLTRENGPPSDGHARAADLAVTAPLSKVTLWTADPARGGLGGCHGDSGGPLYDAEGKLVAVVAWTNGTQGRGCGAITQGPLLTPQQAWIDSILTGWGE